MNLKYKEDFNRAKKYMEAFWLKEVIDRPVICVTAWRDGKKPVTNRNWVYLQNLNKECDYQRTMEEFDAIAEATYYGGESIPFFTATFGPDQYATFLGASIHYAKETDTSWVDPCIDDITKSEIKLQNLKVGTYERYLEFSRYFTQYSEGKFLQCIADLHGNIDCLSAMRGPMNMCYDVSDYPDEVEKAVCKVLDTYPRIIEDLFLAADVKKRGSIGWAPMYCSGRCAVIQCDFSCMLSPDDARRFVIPAIKKEASYLDHNVYHFDGKGALGHLNDVLAIPEIDVIQWVPGAGQPRTFEWMDLLKKIQASGKGLWIYDWTSEEIRQYYKELRPEGLVFSLDGNSTDEADSLVEWLTRNT